MRSFVTAVLVGAGLLAAVAPTAAQVPGIELKLNPRIGVYVPLTDLGELGGETFELNNSLAIGLGAELQLAGLPFGIRGNLDYATSSTVSADGVEQEGSDLTLLALAADLVFRPLPNIILFQPYLFAGGGVKQYNPEDESGNTTTDPTVHLGFGLEVGFGPLALNAELGDYISWYELTDASDESEMQHDLFITVGIAIGLL